MENTKRGRGQWVHPWWKIVLRKFRGRGISTFIDYSIVVIQVRLCLVRVKVFPENISFSGNAIFRKGKYFHVFGYISKYFSKNIFWYLEKKLEKKKEETKPRKTRTNPEEHGAISRSTARSRDRRSDLAIDGAISDRNRRHDLTKRRSRSMRTVLRKIVISDRDRRHDLAKHRSRLVRTVLHEIAPSDCDRRRDLAFFLSLVLPLRVPSSGNHLK